MDKTHKKHILNNMLKDANDIKSQLTSYIKDNNIKKTKLKQIVDDMIRRLERMLKTL